jgi:hypothetical protein
LAADLPVAERFPVESQATLREALDHVTNLARQQLDQLKISCLMRKQSG